ncbi:endonuclease V [bacterium 336/3]|nr:endonuclease V [bacterium 336/3]
MIFAFDTHYNNNKAHTVCMGFENWTDKEATLELSEDLEVPDEYVSGEFYKRELPCIMSILTQIKLQKEDIIVVDGFVVLDDRGKLGLGGHLYEELNRQVPIIGVAKSNFATLNTLKREVYRGDSKRPLYITSLGIDLDKATAYVQSMHGAYRIPDILKKLDQKTKFLI